ncbi:MAG: alpha/beta hydrolase [Deltaproteobacteria bacterium]|nr:alpha/beta hydrolase [Deltaproteobacteria bacterium]
MTPFSRRFWIFGVPILLALLMLGALFQVSTRQALQRAEAFQFRRMLVTEQGDGGTFRFFYATNRRMEQEDGAVDGRFGNERGDELKFGRFDTDIEPSLGIGMLVNPTDWFQNEEIRLLDVRGLEQADFIDELREQVQASPHNSLLVNVNGFRERFPSALRKTAFLAHVLDINSPLLVFDWPGDQGSSPLGYQRAQRVARASGEELAQTLELIIREVQPERLWLLANSMGGEVVVHAFTLLRREADLADPQAEFEHVVLTAPDVGHEEFGRQFKDEISALTKSLTVYVSSNDRALLMSRILNRRRRLGESTVNPANPDQAEEAAKAFEMVEPNSELVTLVDVTPVNRTRNFHNFSLETPEFFDDLFMRLTNIDTPRTRLRYRVQTRGGAQYWVLTRGR